MSVQLNSEDWIIRPAVAMRGGARRAAEPASFFPREFLTGESQVAEEFEAQPAAAPRRDLGSTPTPGPLDFSYDLGPGETAILAIRHPSGALTFHRPVESTTRGVRKAGSVRFVVTVRSSSAATGTRGIVSQAIKAIVIKVGKVAADKAVSLLLPKLATLFEKTAWSKRRLKEGWVRISKDSLAAGVLDPAAPASPERSLLFLHGTFSHAAAAFAPLATSNFFERVAPFYGDRIFGFDHFSVSRTPEQNVQLLLQDLPDRFRGTFDVVTHSRGGLVLRNLVERASAFGSASQKFRLGRAVLVASPNDGTPLATPQRWDDTVGWVANLLELFPENPFTTGAEFVANAIVWLARHASGDLPGLHSMDGAGDLIAQLQGPPGPPDNAYSALVANYHPADDVWRRMLDTGIDQFFASANDLVVPSEGGWRIDRSGGPFIPASRIGCFGAGGNLAPDTVTHVSFFNHQETVDFLVNALSGQPHALRPVSLDMPLPDHRLVRGTLAAPSPAEARPRARRLVRDGAGIADRPAAAAGRTVAADDALRVTVVNGDLTFEDAPLLLGHYRATRLTGTERVMNELVGGTMKHSLDLGVYPLTPGTSQVFVNTHKDPESLRRLPRPQAVIVVGLGEEGKLRPADLSHSIHQAVIVWAQRMAEVRKKDRKTFNLAATLIGSGGTGISAGQAAQYIAEGVFEANQLLRDRQQGGAWPVVGHLRLIELYLDRAAEAWRSLKMHADASPGRFTVSDVVEAGIGALPRAMDSGYRGVDYDFVTAETQTLPNGETQIAYTLDTKRARTEVRAQRTQGRLLRDLISTASNDRNADPLIGPTLFKLLIPVEMEPFLAGSGEMQIELDGGTAGIPWELLDTGVDVDDEDRRPWSIRAKLLRKLRTATFRAQVADASTDASVLVIGEPACPPAYPRLSGARAEARAVCERLTEPGALDAKRVQTLISPDDPNAPGPDARTVINALLERDWRIIHIAGHGALPTDASEPGGVVLSNGTFLGPREIATMRTVPELVFVNCCHLAARDIEQVLRPEDPVLTPYDRAAFAAGVAEQLIQIGVRCVIAAGWAVDDAAASVFAATFYEALLRGERFIDAVGDARNAAYEEGGNTWAAYQCYGDPDWMLKRGETDAERPSTATVDQYAGVSSAAALRLALETSLVGMRFQKARPAVEVERLRELEQRFAPHWGSEGAVAEAFGHAYAAARDVESAMRWYGKALSANDGAASIKAAEQLGNLRARAAWEAVEKAQAQHRAALDAKGAGGGHGRTKSAAVREATRALAVAVDAGRQAIEAAAALFDTLVCLQPTIERESLYGSALKRLAMIEEAAGRHAEARKAVEGMKVHYQRAQALGKTAQDRDVFYPAMNFMAAELVLNAGRAQWKGFPKALIEETRRSIDTRCDTDPDFWSVVGQTELRIFEAVAARKLSAALSSIERDFEDLFRRVSAPWYWSSVYDNAWFVLSRFTAQVKAPAERAAAATLLARLRGFSGGTASQDRD